MKVKITAESKKVITLDMADVARRIVREFSEDISTAADYAMSAATAITNDIVTIVKADAHIARNYRAYNSISDDSNDLDVWIEFLGYVGTTNYMTASEYIVGGAYITDIWNITSDNAHDIAEKHMYYRIFKAND